MNIIVNIDKNTLANKQPKIYDLGEVTTSIQDLLDNSTITITNDRLVILRFTDLDLSVKQGFLNLNNYTEGDKYGLGQNILESDLIYFSSGSSGDFIPLSGTTAGNPVSGDIELSNPTSYGNFYQFLNNVLSEISIVDSGINAGLMNYNNNNTSTFDVVEDFIRFRVDNNGNFTEFNIDQDGFKFDSNKNGSRGIFSEIDYTNNITDLDYTQKIYVDGLRGKYISKTTIEINAIATPQDGETYFNTTLLTLCFWDGSAWRKVSHSAM